MRTYLVFGFAITSLTGGLVLASDGTAPVSNIDAEMALLQMLRPNLAREQYVASILAPARSADREKDGLDLQDIDAQKKDQDAGWRAARIAEVMRYDYDNDLSVSSAEIEQFAPGDANTRKQQAAYILKEFDTNKDGTVTLNEAMAKERRGKSNSLQHLLVADRNGDGRATANELSSLAQETFDRVDTDGDGLLSMVEYQPVAERQQVKAEVQRLRDAGCTFPAPGPKTRIVGFGVNEGDTISTSYVGEPDDVTSVIDVQIERGSQPIYLLFTSYDPVIWRLSGDVGRVERIVASSFHTGFPQPQDGLRASSASAVGFIGVPKSKVSITSRACLTDIRPEKDGETGHRATAEAQIATIVGRPPDGLFGEYSPYKVALPSGTVFPAPAGANSVPNGFDPDVWQEAARFWSGGLATINPADVVAAVPVEPYKVLPAGMGLSQLVGQGAARKLERGRYLLLRDIDRIPPGMGGAHSAVLVLDEGLKRPPGNPVHGCVVTLAEAAKWSGPHICHELRKPPERVSPRVNR